MAKAGLAARWLIPAALLAAPLATFSAADESFRIPKLAAAGSLLALAIALEAGRGLSRRTLGLTALLVLPFALAWLTSTRAEVSGLAFLRALPFLLFVPLLAETHDAALARRAENMLLIAGTLNALLALSQVARLWSPVVLQNPELLDTRTAVIAWVGNAGTLGLFLVVPFTIALARGLSGDRRYLALAGLLIVALAATATLTAVITAVLAAAILLGGRARELLKSPAHRRRVALAIGICALLALATPTVRQRIAEKADALQSANLDKILTRRLAGWRTAIEMFRERPLLGVGLATFSARYYPSRMAALEADPTIVQRETQRKTFAEAHNDPLQLLAEAGLLGFLPLAAVAGWALYAAWRRRRSDDPLPLAVLAPALVGSLVQFPFQTVATAVPILYFAGRGLANESARSERRAAPAGGKLLVVALLALALVSIHRYMRDLSASMRVARAAGLASQGAAMGSPAGAPLVRRGLAEAERARQENPTSVPAANAVAACWVLIGDGEKARAAYQAAAQLEPRVEFDFQLAELAFREGRREEAATLYARVLRYDHAWARKIEDSTLAAIGRSDLVEWKRRRRERAR